jgi:curli biogenesis system outer membrane secretion channel CsgG/membrane-associated protease RseP (regulator of RpoE activity)
VELQAVETVKGETIMRARVAQNPYPRSLALVAGLVLIILPHYLLAYGIQLVRDLPNGAQGAMILAVEPDSVVVKAGIKPGDVVLQINGKPVTNSQQFTDTLNAFPLDQSMMLTIQRDGWERRIQLPAWEDVAPRVTVPVKGNESAWFGFTIGPMTAPNPPGYGAVIASVDVSGPAQKAGLRPGDVVTGAEGTKIIGSSDLDALLRTPRQSKMLTLTIARDGWEKRVTLEQAKVIYRTDPGQQTPPVQQPSTDIAPTRYVPVTPQPRGIDTPPTRYQSSTPPAQVNETPTSYQPVAPPTAPVEAPRPYVSQQTANAVLPLAPAAPVYGKGGQVVPTQPLPAPQAGLQPSQLGATLSRQSSQQEFRKPAASAPKLLPPRDQSLPPRASVSVGDFSIKAAQAPGAIGDGLREMLITALHNTGKFIVVERLDIRGLVAEQALSRSAMARKDEAIGQGYMDVADLMVYATVSEFEAQAGGGGIGIGIPLKNVPLNIGASSKSAHMAIDLRVVDVGTGRVLATQRLTGSASASSTSIGLSPRVKDMTLPVTIDAFKNTPMEQAIRTCVDQAAQFVCDKVPQAYYRHRD